MNEINWNALDLVRLTLLSMFIILANICWIPFINRTSRELQLLLQFFLIAVPQSMIVIFPEYSNYQYMLFFVFGVIGAFFSYVRFKLVHGNVSEKEFSDEQLQEQRQFLEKFYNTAPEHNKKSNTISCYQTCIMIMTVTAISAVDFSAFPSEFRKTKAFGLSLMDIGVALIISASGLVMGKYLHGSSKLSPQKVIKMTLPVLAFGLVRGVLGHFNVGADEYGRHWSFFLNLAFVPYTLLVWNALPSPHLVPICCLLIMTSYQYLLSAHSYSDYIFQKNQSSFFESNKVGIFSLIGYACLFSMSCYQGRIFQGRSANFNCAFSNLLAITCSFWLWFMLSSSKLPPSRTLANFNYVIWSLANGSLHATLFTFLDFAMPEKYRFVIFADLVSQYRLSVFVIANVLSHIVRLNCTVKSTSKLYLAGIISSYLFVTLFAVAMVYLNYSKGIIRVISRVKK